MTTSEKRDLERIERYLKPLYDIEKVENAGWIEVEKERYPAFYFYIRHKNAVTKHLVFLSGKCVDMLSNTAQVKDFGGKDIDFITIGYKSAPILEFYQNGDDINLNTILVYEDYVSLREHFFEGNELVQLSQWLRNDSEICALNWDNYGRYVLTVNCCA